MFYVPIQIGIYDINIYKFNRYQQAYDNNATLKR